MLEREDYTEDVPAARKTIFRNCFLRQKKMLKYKGSIASEAITRQHDINAFPSLLENQR